MDQSTLWLSKVFGATSTITVSDKNGDYTETKLSKTATCDAPIDFVYTGAKTTGENCFSE